MAIPEPKCVQWKRRGQRAIRQRLAGMAFDEELAYWHESHQKLMRTLAASKKRMQETQKAGGAPAKRESAAMPEPKCVQWKRKGQRALREKLAGMTRAEERAFWRESYKKMVSEQAESKRRARAEDRH